MLFMFTAVVFFVVDESSTRADELKMPGDMWIVPCFYLKNCLLTLTLFRFTANMIYEKLFNLLIIYFLLEQNDLVSRYLFCDRTTTF